VQTSSLAVPLSPAPAHAQGTLAHVETCAWDDGQGRACAASTAQLPAPRVAWCCMGRRSLCNMAHHSWPNTGTRNVTPCTPPLGTWRVTFPENSARDENSALQAWCAQRGGYGPSSSVAQQGGARGAAWRGSPAHAAHDMPFRALTWRAPEAWPPRLHFTRCHHKMRASGARHVQHAP
jgi:hypothetical protein